MRALIPMLLILVTATATVLGQTSPALWRISEDSHTVIVGWSRSEASDFMRYELWLRPQGGEWGLFRSIPDRNITSTTIRSLEAGTVYELFLRERTANASTESAVLTVVTEQEGGPLPRSFYNLIFIIVAVAIGSLVGVLWFRRRERTAGRTHDEGR